MNEIGLHTMTIDLATGKQLLTFGYNTTNKLVSITDRFGNVTTIERNSQGVPVSITSPDGIVTSLTIDGDNHLTTVTLPGTASYTFN